MAQRHQDSDPVTWGDLRRAYKKLDERISEAFEAIAEGDSAQSSFWDEHEDKINRLQRAVARIKRSLG